MSDVENKKDSISPSEKALQDLNSNSLDTASGGSRVVKSVMTEDDGEHSFDESKLEIPVHKGHVKVKPEYTDNNVILSVNHLKVFFPMVPVHVRLILDEFANIGQIPNFDKLIATIRSREISASIILQSQSQLKTIYKDAADTIVGNCDSTLFLGGKEKSTLKEISELLGKETIDLYNQSENRGSQVSHGLSYQKLGKELMTQDELAVMDGGKCIFMLRGVRPFLSDKYDLTRHPNYRYTADADPKNVFDMERYMKKQRAVVKPTDTFDVYEIDATT